MDGVGWDPIQDEGGSLLVLPAKQLVTYQLETKELGSNAFGEWGALGVTLVVFLCLSWVYLLLININFDALERKGNKTSWVWRNKRFVVVAAITPLLVLAGTVGVYQEEIGNYFANVFGAKKDAVREAIEEISEKDLFPKVGAEIVDVRYSIKGDKPTSTDREVYKVPVLVDNTYLTFKGEEVWQKITGREEYIPLGYVQYLVQSGKGKTFCTVTIPSKSKDMGDKMTISFVCSGKVSGGNITKYKRLKTAERVPSTEEEGAGGYGDSGSSESSGNGQASLEEKGSVA